MSTYIWRFFRNSDILVYVYKYANNNQRRKAEVDNAHYQQTAEAERRGQSMPA
ncbi:MAG: hypothetical protein QG620_941 [Patescibacteria group bacterium]|nr:hypothetical protein [Patescibacteria group bacterium]